MAALDPKGLLDGVLGPARDAFLDLADEFEEITGYDLRVRSGKRTCAEQNDIYAYGRTHHVGQPVQTYAHGCMSWHVLGLAIDADPVDEDGDVVDSCQVYTKAGVIWEDMGGAWGGRFPGFGACGDAGHFEWHPDVKRGDVCPDPTACEEAVARAAELFPEKLKLAKIMGGMFMVTGIAVAAYVLVRPAKASYRR